jgi:hypothetical protein
MPKLIKCKACGGQVSSAAKACPQCGQPIAATSGSCLGSLVKLVGACVIALIWVVACDPFGALKDIDKSNIKKPSSHDKGIIQNVVRKADYDLLRDGMSAIQTW